MSTATLAGHRVTRARVWIPAWGIPWAEVSLDEETSLSGRVELVVADFKLSGTIMSGGIGPVGRSSWRIAAGAGAWGKEIAPKSYANDAGVKASLVLSDAANACGETLDAATLPATQLGQAWARTRAPAARVLEQVVPAGWYVGDDGTTRIGKRATTILQTAAIVGSVDRARQIVELAAESIAGIVPGVTAEGIEAVDVLHELEPGALRTTIWGAGIASTSRRLSSWRRIFDQLDPNRKFRGVYEYRTVLQNVLIFETGRREWFDLQPVRVSTGMPDLQRVSVRPGISGARADVVLGSRVLVTFVDGDPARPVVIAFEEWDGAGYRPTKLEFNAVSQIQLDGTIPVARQFDTVNCGPFTGTIVGPCSAKVKAG